MNQLVLVGYDGSSCARAALQEAIELAGRMAGGEVVVAYCHDVPAGLSCELDPASDAARELREFERHVEHDIEPMLDEAVRLVREAGLKAERVLAWDDPATALPRLARATGSHVICVGTHHRGRLAGLLADSLPHRLLHSSDVPVLVVPEAHVRAAA